MNRNVSAFILGRIARAAVLVLFVSSAALTLVHLAPGDAFSSFDTDPATARAERARLGFDRPYVEQYATWLRRALALDLGESTRFKRPVSMLLAERVPGTLLLGASALLFAMVVGLPLGVAGGARPDRWWARIVRAVSMLLIGSALTTFSGRPPCCWMRRRAVAAYIGRDSAR